MTVTCGNCKHWRKIRDEDLPVKEASWPGPHGECRLITEYSYARFFEKDKAQPAWLHTFLGPKEPEQPVVNAHAESGLITKPEFSCILGES